MLPSAALTAGVLLALVPGWLYLRLRSTRSAALARAGLDELLEVVAVGIATTGAAVAAWALLPASATRLADVRALATDFGTYAPAHVQRIAATAVAVLAGASGLAYALFRVMHRGPRPTLLRETVWAGALGRRGGRYPWVGVMLRDGRLVEGELLAYPVGDEHENRDLALQAPIRVTPAGGGPVRHSPLDRVVLNERDIAQIGLVLGPSAAPSAGAPTVATATGQAGPPRPAPAAEAHEPVEAEAAADARSAGLVRPRPALLVPAGAALALATVASGAVARLAYEDFYRAAGTTLDQVGLTTQRLLTLGVMAVLILAGVVACAAAAAAVVWHAPRLPALAKQVGAVAAAAGTGWAGFALLGHAPTGAYVVAAGVGLAACLLPSAVGLRPWSPEVAHRVVLWAAAAAATVVLVSAWAAVSDAHDYGVRFVTGTAQARGGGLLLDVAVVPVCVAGLDGKPVPDLEPAQLLLGGSNDGYVLLRPGPGARATTVPAGAVVLRGTAPPRGQRLPRCP